MLYASRQRNLGSARILSTLVTAVTLCGLGACDRGSSELAWARAALERNPQVKVVGVDEQRNIIELRIVATDAVVTVTPGELAALPIADLVALTRTPPAQPAQQPLDTPSGPANAVANDENPAPAETLAVTPAEPAPLAPTPYTVEREDGRVKVTGPGISIETAVRPETATPAAPARSDEPLICDGKRFLRLDARQLNVAGDAIVARNGCELHITNSRISAAGTAIVVLDATVHIANSELQGDDAALDARASSRIFMRNNTFNGLVRRDPQAALQDQGGNTWR